MTQAEKQVTITLPDGKTFKVHKGTSVLDAVKANIGEGLARAALAAKVNDAQVDLDFKLEKDATLTVLTFNDKDGKEVFRHSTAHVFALAIQELYPTAKNTIGPAVEEGFYYDFDDLNISQADFEKIEKTMAEIVKQDLKCTRVELTLEEAKRTFKDNPYKLEMAQEFSIGGNKLSAYKIGDKFIDMCRGPHVPSTGYIKAFKLTQLAGAYWRGDQKNKQLTRVYGISFPDKKFLKEHLNMLEEAAKRDHRTIGRQLDLFDTCEEIGQGLILWLPKGNIIKDELETWAKHTEKEWGYKRVTTPIITKENLFYTSEHLPHYKESMYAPIPIEGENYYIKPMNCPFHHMIFKSRTRSYRELPLRLAEYGWCHRFEQSGALFGLMRVRGMQMNDAHIYCTEEQAVDEFLRVIKLHEHYYNILGITEYWMELALRDPQSNKYHGDDAMWKRAEQLMTQAMDKSGVKYRVVKGGAAFYGPKIDFQIKSAIGREFTASTNQIDLFMPKKFNLKYAAQDGTEKTPIVIHRAPLGTHERFIGFLIEHFAGKFPLWLSPVQAKVLTIVDRVQPFAEEVVKQLEAAGIRTEVDFDPATLNKKIRDAQLEQVNYILVVGEKEAEKKTVNVRTRDEKVHGDMPVDELIIKLKEEITSKRLK